MFETIGGEVRDGLRCAMVDRHGSKFSIVSALILMPVYSFCGSTEYSQVAFCCSLTPCRVRDGEGGGQGREKVFPHHRECFTQRRTELRSSIVTLITH